MFNIVVSLSCTCITLLRLFSALHVRGDSNTVQPHCCKEDRQRQNLDTSLVVSFDQQPYPRLGTLPFIPSTIVLQVAGNNARNATLLRTTTVAQGDPAERKGLCINLGRFVVLFIKICQPCAFPTKDSFSAAQPKFNILVFYYYTNLHLTTFFFIL